MALDFGINTGFVEELYAQYLENPESVDPGWRSYFDGRLGSTNGGSELLRRAPGLPLTNGHLARSLDLSLQPHATVSPLGVPSPQDHEREVLAQAAINGRVYKLLNAYRVRGHLFAHIDPLGVPPLRRPSSSSATSSSRRRTSTSPSRRSISRAPTRCRRCARSSSTSKRRTVAASASSTCTSTTPSSAPDPAADGGHEEPPRPARSRAAPILTKLSDAEIFEQFIQRSYGAGTKRFSLEGAESLIPLLDLLIERAGSEGVTEIVLGMAHRGRLNVLANIMDKSLREIFAAFEDKDAQRYLGGGDVKYHLGYSTDRPVESGQSVHLTLSFNPSHLEFVNPVVEGRVRAKQDRIGDQAEARRRVMPLLIHGDAAFIGQGICAETLNLTGLEGYSTGGTIHVIVNNQIGFTTNPSDSRSTRYASDIVRMIKVPVFHVNGEDPEAVAQVTHLAIEYRQRFGKDAVIDMYCYRRYGHNEGDEPRYTQPRMYAAIDKKPTVRQMYVKRLIEMGNVTEEKADEIVVRRRGALEAALEEVKQKGFAPVTYAMGGVWNHYRGGPDAATPEVATAVPVERLRELSHQLVELPHGFKAHPKVVPTLKARHDAIMSGEPFDWGTGEMMAYASLLHDKTPIRISGQDVKRGTFTHRHAVLMDVDKGDEFAPLSTVAVAPGRFQIYNSPLSEQGVLGFDFGYSLDSPSALVVWEAQFGDFLNGAQVIVDQFLTSSEDKWHRLSGLVLYLPHGYEGQGPEHSSARLERFLQNSAEDNIQVCNLTTPAQLFHALRRQVLRPWRKPLVIMTPKSLLRVATTSKGPHRPVSTIKDLAEGRFQRVIPDQSSVDPADVKRILLCSGKVYYDLAVARDERGANDVAIVRMEQLYPWNDELASVLAPYKDGTKLVWVQEEPRNYGGWYYITANLPEALHHRFPISCVARAASASPATGSRASHLLEQKMLIDEAFK